MTLPSVGSNPRRLENLQVGAGYGSSPDGGADLDSAGNLAIDGDLTIDGDLILHGMARDWSIFIPAREMWPAVDFPCGGPTRTRMAWLVEVQSMDFDKDIEETAAFNVFLPEEYDGRALEVALLWTATSGTSGNIYWKVYSMCKGDDDSLVAGYSVTNAVIDTFHAQKDLHIAISILTPDTATAGRFASFAIRRSGDNGQDTFDADALLIGVRIRYA